MNRRQFFKLSVGGIATAAAVSREWPFKVFSFPTDIVIAKTADVDRAARRVLDPIVSMALDGSNAYFFSGIVRRPTQQEYNDYMGIEPTPLTPRVFHNTVNGAGKIDQVLLLKERHFTYEVKTKIVNQFGCSWDLAPTDLPGPLVQS